MTVRIGAVSYLNTKPLIHGLAERIGAGSLILDLPSRLSDQLSLGELDIALIPSVEFFRGPSEWQILSDACIACRGPVRSVQLLFRTQPQKVRTLALDEGSRTSAALAQVLLYDRFGLRPELLPLSMAADYRTYPADATLIIGDRAMQVDSASYVETWDLGQQWYQWTGLPFVFAMWICRQPKDDAWSQSEIAKELEAARDAGLACALDLSQTLATKHHLTVQDCYSYFTEQLHFRLGPSELKGLELFKQRAEHVGLIRNTICQTT